MSEVQRTDVVGIRVDAIPSFDSAIAAVEQALQNRTRFLMTFANPGTAVLARREGVAGLFDQFDMVGPDGIGMVKAIQWLHRLPAIRAAFETNSLAPEVFRLAIQHNRSIVLCGGKPGVAEHAAHQLQAAYSGLPIIATFDGYAAQAATVASICALEPDIVIVGMGGIVQEQFLIALRDSGWNGAGFTCGGFLDQLAGGLQYYPKVIDDWNLRWAYRLAMEPRRLWRRYLLDYPQFATSLCKAMMRTSR